MKIAIIGGSGKMGRFFADFLLKDGKEVVITGRDREKLLEAGHQLGIPVTTDNTEAIDGADYILLSVPIDSFEEVVKQLSSHIKSGQVLIDNTSVKAGPVDIMHKYIKTGSACVIMMLEVILSSGLGIIILRDMLMLNKIIGGILILAGGFFLIKHENR